jgi:hypothetical protein
MSRAFLPVLAIAGLAATTAHAATPASMPVATGLPFERDCTRWEAPRMSAFDRSDERGVPLVGAYAERAPNADPSLQAPLRRPTSVELLLCEQLNVKDKLDWLIRRLAR